MLMRMEKLMLAYPELIYIEDPNMPKMLGGYIEGRVITLNKNKSLYEKYSILAEEIGHHETSYGDILDTSNMRDWKVELVARRWSYKKLVSFDDLIYCYKHHLTTIEDTCTFLEIPPDILKTSLDYYLSHYGLYIDYKGYKIMFDPLNIERIY
ncbi:hypothetical protein [Domibacillus aminovorans]|uniref:IrrE N-terminal-like domain-containing protein n=1 Tax=Domibacillus aminovorans TaxID=29332 RepID=A0A177L495_9BACI|nr:hypothetical protein [Domibacillus aminovorans]OAH60373.1 hypothetical protein AWH49_16730 [Domibacillus aminovorans]